MAENTLQNIDFCIETMTSSLIGSASALQIEIAVSLLVYSTLGSADLDAKRTLRQVYASAGRYDCLTPDSTSYQTISRRMQRSAGLFEKLGAKRLAKIIAGKKDQDALQLLVDGIKPFQLLSWDDVQQFATGIDKKAARIVKTPAQHIRRATDAPDTIHLKTENIKLDIPAVATHKEIMELVQKLIQVSESAKLAA